MEGWRISDFRKGMDEGGAGREKGLGEEVGFGGLRGDPWRGAR